MEVKIFGCRFNKYYGQKRAKKLGEIENAILIASCAVTDNAKRKFMKEVKQQAKNGKYVYLTWCWAFSKNGEIDRIKFFQDYSALAPYQDKIELLPEDPDTEWKVPTPIQTGFYTKHFTLVQLGCDSMCSFCITVKKRWSHKNKPVAEVIKEINQVSKKWVKEIVITGINLAAWGMSTTNQWPNPFFPKYIEQILENTNVPRIRISSIWPEFVEESWYKVLANPRILPYFHLSIQSGSNKILKLMWRHYKQEQVLQLIEKLRNIKKTVPINIWADIIVWFPQESEEDFQETIKICKQGKISQLHVFPFSSHQIWDTVPASKLSGQIDIKTKKDREKILIEICGQNAQELAEQTRWKKVKVLIEQNNAWWTENYLKYESKRNLNSGDIFETIF